MAVCRSQVGMQSEDALALMGVSNIPDLGGTENGMGLQQPDPGEPESSQSTKKAKPDPLPT